MPSWFDADDISIRLPDYLIRYYNKNIFLLYSVIFFKEINTDCEQNGQSR